MPRKPAIINDSAAGAAPARAAKPKAPRVKSAKHAKAPAVAETEAAAESAIGIQAAAAEPVADARATEPAAVAAPVSVSSEAAREEIARIAYGYWEARGFAGGNALEDWVRAEDEYRRRNVA